MGMTPSSLRRLCWVRVECALPAAAAAAVADGGAVYVSASRLVSATESGISRAAGRTDQAPLALPPSPTPANHAQISALLVGCHLIAAGVLA
jgi:hypothetical protein